MPDSLFRCFGLQMVLLFCWCCWQFWTFPKGPAWTSFVYSKLLEGKSFMLLLPLVVLKTGFIFWCFFKCLALLKGLERELLLFWGFFLANPSIRCIFVMNGGKTNPSSSKNHGKNGPGTMICPRKVVVPEHGVCLGVFCFCFFQETFCFSLEKESHSRPMFFGVCNDSKDAFGLIRRQGW